MPIFISFMPTRLIKFIIFILFINLTAKMGDSDDEYDRKRRDKFRGERGGGERERWPDRERYIM